jgi:hypothetical protein
MAEVPNSEEEEEGPRFPPPSQEQVAYRALCLHALVTRIEFQLLARMWLDPQLRPSCSQADGLRARDHALAEWLRREQLTQHQSTRERELFSHALGEWGERTVIDVSWRKESLTVLLWALSLATSLPPYDTQVAEDLHMEKVGWLKPASEFCALVRLRDRATISRARDVAELWHWRSRTTWLQQHGHTPPDSPKELDSFEKIVRVTAEQAYRNGDILRPIKHDFPAFGKPYARLTEQEYSVCTSIAMERHYALNWLCGYAEDWGNVPTDT